MHHLHKLRIYEAEVALKGGELSAVPTWGSGGQQVPELHVEGQQPPWGPVVIWPILWKGVILRSASPMGTSSAFSDRETARA